MSGVVHVKQQPVVKHRATADLFLSACVWTQGGIMGVGQGKDANMFSWMDKNCLQSDGVPGPTGDNRANRSLCSA